MKKKLLCLILIFVLLPASLLFTGCKKGYDLSTLEQNYKNIYSSNKTIKLNENKLTFDYSSYALFNSQVSSNANGYGYVNRYNAMLKNMMAFADSYLSTISAGTYEIDKNIGEKLDSNLSELESSLRNLDVATQDTAYYVGLVQNPSNQHCLVKLNNLFNCYNQTFEDAFNFNATLIEIYFSGTSIQDYTKDTDFSPLRAIVDVKFDARLIQQIVYTTQAFVEIEIDNQEFAKSISIDGNTSFAGKDSVYGSYASVVNSLRKTYTEQNVEYVRIDETRKANFKEWTVKLNNIEQVVDNEISYYVDACNSVKYAEKYNNINATKEDKANMTLVSNFSLINGAYNTALIGMLTELGV